MPFAGLALQGDSRVRHDVTIYSGLRGVFTHRLGEIASELTVGRRYNYLFQNTGYNPSDGGVPVDQPMVIATAVS